MNNYNSITAKHFSSLLIDPVVVFLVSALQHHVDMLSHVAPALGVSPLHFCLERSDLHCLELLQRLEHLPGPLRQLRGGGREGVPEVSDELTDADVELSEVGLDTERTLLGQEIMVRPNHHGSTGGKVSEYRHLQRYYQIKTGQEFCQ